MFNQTGLADNTALQVDNTALYQITSVTPDYKWIMPDYSGLPDYTLLQVDYNGMYWISRITSGLCPITPSDWFTPDYKLIEPDILDQSDENGLKKDYSDYTGLQWIILNYKWTTCGLCPIILNYTGLQVDNGPLYCITLRTLYCRITLDYKWITREYADYTQIRG